jgi:hypothetical protein
MFALNGFNVRKEVSVSVMTESEDRKKRNGLTVVIARFAGQSKSCSEMRRK